MWLAGRSLALLLLAFALPAGASLSLQAVPPAPVASWVETGHVSFLSLAQPDGLLDSDIFLATLTLRTDTQALVVEAQTAAPPVPVPRSSSP